MVKTHRISSILLERLRLALPTKGNSLPNGLVVEDAAWDTQVQGDYDWILLHAAVILEDMVVKS